MTDENGATARLTLNFPTTEDKYERVKGFVIVALSLTSGVPEDDIRISQISSRLDSRKTNILLNINASSEIESWKRMSQLRAVVSEPSSTLNTVGHMKKVFNGAIFNVYDPTKASAASPEKPQTVRYSAKAPRDSMVVPRAPTSLSALVGTAEIVKDGKRRSPKHRLPPDSIHHPFDLLVIPSGVKSPPESPKREMHLHLPRPTETRKDDDFQTLDLIDMKPLLGLLNSPRPTIPASLGALFHELNKT